MKSKIGRSSWHRELRSYELKDKDWLKLSKSTMKKRKAMMMFVMLRSKKKIIFSKT